MFSLKSVEIIRISPSRGSLSIADLPTGLKFSLVEQAICRWVPFAIRLWGSLSHCESIKKVLRKNATQCPEPGHEPRPVNSELRIEPFGHWVSGSCFRNKLYFQMPLTVAGLNLFLYKAACHLFR